MMPMQLKRMMAVFVSVAMVVALTPTSAQALQTGQVVASAASTMTVSNPSVAADSSMVSGQKTTWDCVWLGSYPQAVVSEATTIRALDSATWSDNRTTLEGVAYQRMSSSEATNGSDFSANYGSSGYLYFICEPVKWRVLETDGSSALVLADQAIDCQPYNGEAKSVTWETCTLRSWLNAGFANAAFSADQKGAIQRQHLANPDNDSYGTKGGNGTSDDIFLLSLADVEGSGAKAHGFSEDTGDDEARCAHVSDFAYAMGAYRSTWHSCQPDSGQWWLRSPGNYEGNVSGVHHNGRISPDYDGADYSWIAVRPALRLSLSSNQITYAGTVCSDGVNVEVGKSEAVTPADASGQSASDSAAKPGANEKAISKGEKFESELFKFEVTKATGSQTAQIIGLTPKGKKASKLTVPSETNCKDVKLTVTSIKASAFKGAAARSAVIGGNVTSIGKSAFKGCKKLKTVTVKSKKLKKKSVKKCLQGSKVAVIKVSVGKRRPTSPTPRSTKRSSRRRMQAEPPK